MVWCCCRPASRRKVIDCEGWISWSAIVGETDQSTVLSFVRKYTESNSARLSKAADGKAVSVAAARNDLAMLCGPPPLSSTRLAQIRDSLPRADLVAFDALGIDSSMLAHEYVLVLQQFPARFDDAQFLCEQLFRKVSVEELVESEDEKRRQSSDESGDQTSLEEAAPVRVMPRRRHSEQAMMAGVERETVSDSKVKSPYPGLSMPLALPLFLSDSLSLSLTLALALTLFRARSLSLSPAGPGAVRPSQHGGPRTPKQKKEPAIQLVGAASDGGSVLPPLPAFASARRGRRPHSSSSADAMKRHRESRRRRSTANSGGASSGSDSDDGDASDVRRRRSETAAPQRAAPDSETATQRVSNRRYSHYSARNRSRLPTAQWSSDSAGSSAG